MGRALVPDGKFPAAMISSYDNVILKEVVDNVARGDAEASLANGKFLEDKFREGDFLQPRSAETVSSGGA
jgi:hypothetical protein